MKNKNSGFSLFTVLIAVSFLSIMGLLLLYISVANFQIQTTDLEGTDSFYTAEQALEEIRTGLQQDVGEAMSEAYLSVMESYSAAESSDESLDDLRHEAFTEKYLTVLTGILSGTGGTETIAASSGTSLTETKTYSLDRLIGYVDLYDTIDEDSETLVITNPTGTSPEMEVESENGEPLGVLLKNIKVIYVDARGRSSIIQTDILLGIPNIEFPTPSTLPDLMNMIVVAGGGIECEAANDSEDPNGEITINGSVYAGSDGNGVSILLNENQKLVISGGDQVVCQGEVLVKKGSSFTASENVMLWASGVTLSEASVSLLGKSYIADDLTVESGSGSQVVISGEYYGYGSPDSARASHNNYSETTWKDADSENTGVLDEASDASLSSSIVINGKNTTLDLSGLTKLMLAGRSYVSGSAQNGLLDESGSGYGNDSGSDVLMGESLTVKGTQIAYLLPASLLKSLNSDYSETLTNPMSYEQYGSGASNIVSAADTSAFVDMDQQVSEWGGKSLREIGVDETDPVKTVFYADNSSGGYVYFYLNFTDETKAAEFMQTYYQQNSEVKALMDKYLSFYFPNTGAGITLKDSDTYLRYITAGSYLISGNILTFEGTTDSTGSGNLLTGSDEETSLFDTQKGYQNMWYALNRKMIGSYDLLETNVKDADGEFDHNETYANRSVFDNLVNEKTMVEFVNEHGNDKNGNSSSGSQQYWFLEDGDPQAVFANNGSGTVTVTTKDEEGNITGSEIYQGYNDELVIDSEMAETIRLVVCTGDVRIRSGVSFSGIIMAKGKITLEAGASLQSTPIEAARVFQAQMAADSAALEVAPRDFFWDGEEYVLGSSSDSDSSGSSSGSQSDTYDISQAISYENWKKM